MVRPAQRRELVSWAIASYQISERTACRATGSQRSSIRYRSVRPHQEALRRRIREIAAVRTRAGYPLIHTLLRREGLARESETDLPSVPRRRPQFEDSKTTETPIGCSSSEAGRTGWNRTRVWAMDFVRTTPSPMVPRFARDLTAIDVATRECAALISCQRIQRLRCGEGFSVEARSHRGELPKQVRVDNGTEFASKALRSLGLLESCRASTSSRPGKPGAIMRSSRPSTGR